MRKLLTIFLLATAVIISNIPDVFGAEDSAKITNEDAQNALKDVIPEVKILDIRPAKIQGLWEIALEAKGQKGIIYLHSSRNFAVFGSLLDLKTKTNLTQERTNELNKAEVSTIPLDDAPSIAASSCSGLLHNGTGRGSGSGAASVGSAKCGLATGPAAIDARG